MIYYYIKCRLLVSAQNVEIHAQNAIVMLILLILIRFGFAWIAIENIAANAVFVEGVNQVVVLEKSVMTAIK